MADFILFLTIVIIIAVFCWVIAQFDSSLDFFKLFLLLMIIPLMYALVSTGMDLGRNCALVYDTDTNTLTQMCANEPSNLWIWLLKIMNFMFYAEIIAVILYLLYMAIDALQKKGVVKK